jgi:hypothetical protein
MYISRGFETQRAVSDPKWYSGGLDPVRPVSCWAKWNANNPEVWLASFLGTFILYKPATAAYTA